eukprot:gene1398-32767_t
MSVCEPENHPEVSAVAGRLRNEYVVRVEGVLRQRKDINKKIPTGDVELVAHHVTVLNSVNKSVPFPISQQVSPVPYYCSFR